MGFETEIAELHSIPGGECTGWDRGGYHFDGCIDWLMGSKPGVPLHKIWRDTGALDDNVRIINQDIYTQYEEDATAVNLYTNADKLEAELLRVAPEDKKEIKNLCGAIRRLGGLSMPVDKPMDLMNAGDGVKFMAQNLGAMPVMTKYGKMNIAEFAALFKNPVLRNLFSALMPGHYTSMSLLFMLAGMNSGDCGYPEGGSRAFAKRIENKYVSLGGRISYLSRVKKILIENGKAVGIALENGEERRADYVVSCADGYATLVHMLEDKYTPDVYRELFGHPDRHPTVTCALVYLGIDAEIMQKCRGIVIKRETPVPLCGMVSGYRSLHSYAFDKHMAPKGKTVVSCYYDADYDYWKALSLDREKYLAEKEKLKDDAVAAVTERFPEAEGKIEVADVVTPVTYERYCNAWRGAWMTWVTSGDKTVPRYVSGVLPGLENFIMAGMWTLPPGGLPGACTAGKFAAQRLCMQEGIAFRAE